MRRPHYIYYISLDHPNVDKPHLATIACTLLAVAGRARKDVAQVIWDCPSVTNGYNRQFPQDILYL